MFVFMYNYALHQEDDKKFESFNCPRTASSLSYINYVYIPSYHNKIIFNMGSSHPSPAKH